MSDDRFVKTGIAQRNCLSVEKSDSVHLELTLWHPSQTALFSMEHIFQSMFWEHLLVHILLCSCFSLETFVWIVTPRWFCCRTSVQCPIGILNQISIGSFLTQAANFATRNWKLMTRVAESGLPRFVTLAPNWLYSSSSSSLSPCVFLCVCSCPGSSIPPFLTLSHCQSAKKKPPLPWQ